MNEKNRHLEIATSPPEKVKILVASGVEREAVPGLAFLLE
jgi:hypothetical protein